MIKQSKKPWRCSECQDAETKICKHLQALLPKDTHKSVKVYLSRDIDTLSGLFEVTHNPEDKEFLFRLKLKAYHLPKLYVDVITYKFVFNMNMKQIAKKLNIPDVNTAYNIYRNSLELLRERKYE